MDDLSFGKFIKIKRVTLGYSLAELVKELGCSISYLSLVEREKEIPSEVLINKLSKALDIDSKKLTSMATLVRIENMKEIPLEEKNALISFYKSRSQKAGLSKSKKTEATA